MGKKKKDVVAAEAPATGTNPEKAPTLLWNERGQIGCTLPGHAPHKGTDTWRFEHWKKIPAGTLNEDGQPFACETCKAGAPATETSPAAPAEEPVAAMPEAAPEASANGVVETTEVPEPQAEAPKRKGRKLKEPLTLAGLAERYLAHLEKEGHSAGTLASYGLELRTALNALGDDTNVEDLTRSKVRAYFDSAKVTKKRNGKAKSPLSIAKTQRVLRLALVYAAEMCWIGMAPLPVEAKAS